MYGFICVTIKNNHMKLSSVTKKDISSLLYISILILSVFLVLSISIGIFNGTPFYTESSYLRAQFWICLWFLFTLVVDFSMSDNKVRYFWIHIPFLIVSIPYQAIIAYYQWTFSSELTYMIHFMPLIRGGYALAIFVGWFTSNKISNMFVTYLTMLLATVYFSSLAFYALEYDINPNVNVYGDAVWWAFMNVTTVGSDIVAMTVTGKVLSVLLAAIGMMMFPIFTVYITNLISSNTAKTNKKEGEEIVNS